jgi:hypothetical protein
MKVVRQLDSTEIKEHIRVFTEEHEIDPRVAEHLGWYVYALYEPDATLPFYIGKGKGTRVLQHFDEAIRLENDVTKLSVIRDLFAEGKAPSIRIIRRSIKSEELAYAIEASLIDALVPKGNIVLGHESGKFGITDLKHLIAEYSATPLEESDIVDPLMFIKVDQLWEQYGLSRHFDPNILYEITRGFWKVNLKRVKGRLVCAVAGGIIRNIYEPEEWHSAGDITHLDWRRLPNNPDRRFQFSGNPALKPRHRKYVNRSVKHLFKKGAQSPVTYWPRATH